MEQYLDQLVEAIEHRHSVRTYEAIAVSEELLASIRSYIEECTKEFGDAIRISFIENKDNKVKLGTYGVIKGASYFLAAACKNGAYDEFKLGYALEKIVLYCTSIGLGTVWLGGTYKKSSFAEVMNLESNEEIKIVVPFGYEAEKKSMVAKLMGDNSKKRKDFGDIYFEKDAKTPLTREQAGKYEEALEKMRFAPSAINKQPWRVIKDGNTLHFCVTDVKAYRKIDLGIGMSHFHLMVEQQGIEGEFVRMSNVACEPFTYVVSWVEK